MPPRAEVLSYEASTGGLQLVGVEFVVVAQTWLASHTTPAVIKGPTFLFVGARTGTTTNQRRCTANTARYNETALLTMFCV